MSQYSTTPTFPSCEAPQGSLKVSYDTGTHGIVGDMSEHTGSDRVYTLTDSTLTQCYCNTSAQGIQTNWWKVPGITDTELSILKKEGWLYVHTGSVWGLTDDPYMAYNSSFSCNSSGHVLGDYKDTQVLAGTGGSLQLAGILFIGVMLLIIGWKMRKHV